MTRKVHRFANELRRCRFQKRDADLVRAGCGLEVYRFTTSNREECIECKRPGCLRKRGGR